MADRYESKKCDRCGNTYEYDIMDYMDTGECDKCMNKVPSLTAPQADYQVKVLERALTQEVTKAVEKHISDQVQPIVDKLVKELAGEAVKNWAFKYKAQQKGDFGTTTEISVRFVENIIRTQMVENDISIKVQK